MADGISREPMLDMFLFESNQLLEQLEQIILKSEKAGRFDDASINEIFRIMHTIKGSSAMMLFNNISKSAHAVEDLFYYLREEKPGKVDHSKISDMVLEVLDFVKEEMLKIEEGETADGDPEALILKIKELLTELKADNGSAQSKDGRKKATVPEKAKAAKYYISPDKDSKKTDINVFEACIYFEDGCEMENIRAFTLMHNLKDKVEIIKTVPEDVLENEDAVAMIRSMGFMIVFKTEMDELEAKSIFDDTLFVSNIELTLLNDEQLKEQTNEVKEIRLNEPEIKKSISDIVLEDSEENQNTKPQKSDTDTVQKSAKQNFISVNLAKLDTLMDIVGELVISESMVTRNPDLNGLELANFSKAARQLRKLTSELQDIVMSVRMVPLTATFQKMNRIVRDMSKKLNKDVILEVIGEETEVDKNIIENISDPIMHLIRNSIDHGLESAEEREANGKPRAGKVILEAKNSGGDVCIIVRDDGKGLNRDKILEKAKEHGLVKKPDNELSDREIYSFIMLPGFSTKEKVTEFSGRGVGLDVVVKNVEKIGGNVLIDSVPGQGTTFSIKIPLTLAIIDGMIVNVGKSSYVVPTISIKESFRPKADEIITDPDGNEMILIRGKCFPIMRLHRHFDIKTKVTAIEEGILVMIQNDFKGICLFADALIGEQQVVVKAMPKYIKKVRGIAGCTMLGDGSISLILDIGALIDLESER